MVLYPALNLSGKSSDIQTTVAYDHLFVSVPLCTQTKHLIDFRSSRLSDVWVGICSSPSRFYIASHTHSHIDLIVR
jgi:hypothetical protein